METRNGYRTVTVSRDTSLSSNTANVSDDDDLSSWLYVEWLSVVEEEVPIHDIRHLDHEPGSECQNCHKSYRLKSLSERNKLTQILKDHEARNEPIPF